MGPGPAVHGEGRRASQFLSRAVKAETPKRSCWVFAVSASEGGAGCQGLGVVTATAGAPRFAEPLPWESPRVRAESWFAHVPAEELGQVASLFCAPFPYL